MHWLPFAGLEGAGHEKYITLYYSMDFQLIDTNTPEVGKEEEQQTEEETYEDIQQGKTKPTTSILEKKRQNKTV